MMYARLIRRNTRPWHLIRNNLTVCGIRITKFHAPVEYSKVKPQGEHCGNCAGKVGQ